MKTLDPICQGFLLAGSLIQPKDPESRLKIVQMFHMLIGLFKASWTANKYEIAFEWFYDHRKVMEKALEIYQDD